jgi:23S rRNA (uracil1939-C5)-methyltransferase
MNNPTLKKGYKVYSDVLLTDMHSAGRSIGKIGNRNVYIDFGVPGEIVSIEVKRRQKPGRFVLGSIQKIHSKSRHRTEPFCKHFGTCGGCNWQHINYETQLEWKRNILINALSKYGIATPIIPDVLASPQTIYYRNKLEYSFSSHWCLNEKDESKCIQVLGFHLVNNPEKVIEIDECFLLNKQNNLICEEIKNFSLIHDYAYYNYQEKSGFLKSITFRTTSKNQIMVIVGFALDDQEGINKFLTFLQTHFSEFTSVYYYIFKDTEKKENNFKIKYFCGDQVIFEYIDDLKFQIGSSSFFQPNLNQAIEIYKKVKEFAQLKHSENVVDLYTGIGTIACYLSREANKVTGIEGSISAIEDANANAKINHIKNIEFITGDILKTFTQDFIKKRGKPDVIVLDPPRSGTLIEIKKTILASEPSRIIYISCNPVSLAWDLKQLTDKYKVVAIQPFDMFPHTHHLETVVLLSNKK